MFLGFSDLVNRWVYTRQGVHKLARLSGFPKPAFTINQGRTKVWRLADIEGFEQQHPELRNEDAKRDKVIGFYRAVMKGDRRPSS